MDSSDSEATTAAALPALAPGRELEIKFKTDAVGLKLALHSELLSTGAKDAPSRTLRSVYFDTPAGDLRKHRMVLRVRQARNAHILGLKWAGSPAEGPFSRGEIEVRAPSLDLDVALFGAEIAGELSRIIDGRPLEMKFETQIKRRVRQLTFGRSEIEAAFDEGFVVAGDRRQPLTEVELELKAGEETALYDLAIRVANALPLHLDMMSKAERGFMLAAGDRPSPVKAADPRFPAESTLDDAVEIVIADALAQFVANWPALAESRDPESIHQMRVALRRLRTALAFFNRALPCAEFEVFRAEAKRIASAFGPARNWDAFLDLVEQGPLTHHSRDESFAALLTIVEDRRAAAYAIAQSLIDDPSTTRFVLNLHSFVARRAWRSGLSGVELPRLTEPVRLFAGETLERLHKRALKRGEGLSRMPPEERHQLRIALKNLRYAAEFFGVIFGGSKARPYSRAVARLQNGLGAYNDAATATSLLREIEAAGGARSAKAGGVILGWCGRGAVIGDEGLLKAWKAFKRSRLFWR